MELSVWPNIFRVFFGRFSFRGTFKSRYPMKSMLFRPPLGSTLGELTGTMLIGARDTTNCEDEWTYFPNGVDIIQTNSVPVLTYVQKFNLLFN